MVWFQENIEKEYQEYRNQMLKRTTEQIWNKCSEIHFYSCIYEYFMYNEAITYGVAKQLGERKDIIAGCWDLYLKNEELSVLSWADIDILIERFLQIGGK